MENSEFLSKTAYHRTYLKGRMSCKAFFGYYDGLMKDKDFKEKFGKYRARKLSPKQIKMLNKEFIN